MVFFAARVDGASGARGAPGFGVGELCGGLATGAGAGGLLAGVAPATAGPEGGLTGFFEGARPGAPIAAERLALSWTDRPIAPSVGGA